MAAVLDTLRFSQRLQQAGVSREQAEAHAEVARDMVMADLVTKDDLVAVKTELLSALREQELRITIKFGAMMVAAVGVIVAAIRAF